MDYCKRYVKVAFKNDGPGRAVFTRLRCKQWDCEYCAKKNASMWRAHLNERLPEISDTWWLLTLTANENTRTRHESLTNIRNGIDALFKRVRRIFTGIEYVRVYERHPTSEAIHAHLIVCGLTMYVKRNISPKKVVHFTPLTERKGYRGTWQTRTWFKINCRALKMGYIVDLRVIEGQPGRAIHYVLKYATKALQDLHEPYLRHVQVTTGIGGLKPEKTEGWITASYITSSMFKPGTKIEDLNTGAVIDNNYWEVSGNTFYPRED